MAKKQSWSFDVLVKTSFSNSLFVKGEKLFKNVSSVVVDSAGALHVSGCVVLSADEWISYTVE